jgi:hypothetical protein
MLIGLSKFGKDTLLDNKKMIRMLLKKSKIEMQHGLRKNIQILFLKIHLHLNLILDSIYLFQISLVEVLVIMDMI